MTTDPRDDPRSTTDSPSPGASSPGEPGYEGDVTVGDEAGAGYPESFDDPFGRPGPPIPPED